MIPYVESWPSAEKKKLLSKGYVKHDPGIPRRRIPLEGKAAPCPILYAVSKNRWHPAWLRITVARCGWIGLDWTIVHDSQHTYAGRAKVVGEPVD